MQRYRLLSYDPWSNVRACLSTPTSVLSPPAIMCGWLQLCVLLSVLYGGQTTSPHRISDQYLDIDYTEGLTRFILNIGAHDRPPDVFNNNTIVVAVEPLPEVASQIPTMKNRYVLTAAVADYYGIATFHHWMDSSSLLETNPQTDGVHRAKGKQGSKIMVPVLPFPALLDTLNLLQCWLVKTDMQHMDLTAIKAAGEALKRCHWILAEVQCGGHQYYLGAENDYHKNWLPYMEHMGFEPFRDTEDVCAGGMSGPLEMNALFMNKNIPVDPRPTREECLKCYE